MMTTLLYVRIQILTFAVFAIVLRATIKRAQLG